MQCQGEDDLARLSGQERRKLIIEGALDVILAKGLAGTATRDVTRKLGVGSGLLHHYFDTWGELRAEVVRRFVSAEIEDLKATLSNAPRDTLVKQFVTWMTVDPEFRFWKLWLDAVEEARRDPQLARIVEEGHAQWHAAIVEVISRVSEKVENAQNDVSHAAWRISATVDGLMGMLVLGQKPLTPELVRQLLTEQICVELGHTVKRVPDHQ